MYKLKCLEHVTDAPLCTNIVKCGWTHQCGWINSFFQLHFHIPHIYFHISDKSLKQHCGNIVKWNREEFINSSTIHKYSSIFDKSLEQHCRNTLEEWNVEEFINFSKFIHSSIFNKSLEKCCRIIVGKWNVEDYLNSSTFHIYISIFIHSFIFN